MNLRETSISDFYQLNPQNKLKESTKPKPPPTQKVQPQSEQKWATELSWDVKSPDLFWNLRSMHINKYREKQASHNELEHLVRQPHRRLYYNDSNHYEILIITRSRDTIDDRPYTSSQAVCWLLWYYRVCFPLKPYRAIASCLRRLHPWGMHEYDSYHTSSRDPSYS